MNLVVLFEVCLRQACGLNHKWFAGCSPLLRAGDTSKDAKTTEDKNDVAALEPHLKSEGHRSDYSLVALDAIAAPHDRLDSFPEGGFECMGDAVARLWPEIQWIEKPKLLREQVTAIIDEVTALTGPGELIDVVSERVIAIYPRHQD
jgi:hypothetical protein